jgi:hypothetical protein
VGLKLPTRLTSVADAPGRLVAVGLLDNTARIGDIATGQLIECLPKTESSNMTYGICDTDYVTEHVQGCAQRGNTSSHSPSHVQHSEVTQLENISTTSTVGLRSIC